MEMRLKRNLQESGERKKQKKSEGEQRGREDYGGLDDGALHGRAVILAGGWRRLLQGDIHI